MLTSHLNKFITLLVFIVFGVICSLSWGNLDLGGKINLAIAFLTGLTAWFAYLAVSATRKVSEAELSSELLRQFASREMFKAMRSLKAWKREHENNLEAAYLEIVRKDFDAGEVSNEEQYRRLVSHFAHMIRILYKTGALGRDSPINEVLEDSLACFVIDVILPLDRIVVTAQGGEFKEEKYEFFKHYYKKEMKLGQLQTTGLESQAERLIEKEVSDVFLSSDD